MGLTQAEMAERIGMTRNSVARMERGEMIVTPPMALLISFVAREAGVERRRQRPRVLETMKARDWGLVETAVRVGVSNKTLAKILDGKIPKRLDALYRILDGLKIPIEEALINASTYQTKERPKLYLVSR